MESSGSEKRIEALLDDMTIEEQISLLAGRDYWTTVPIERLKIPSIKVSDGPNGARGGGALVGGVKAAAFPVGIALAASWNVALVMEIAADLAREAKTKGARVLLAPTVNMHRSTLNGRNFECYSEDPFLTSELAVAYVAGLQGHGVGATVKHFIGNESEYQRTTISSDIDQRALREIYMPPFEAVVKRAKTWALMIAYNRLNGAYVSERGELINGVIRSEWGFDGVAMSDWAGARSTAAALNAGLDLEMPGPGVYRGRKLVDAFKAGLVGAPVIREAARRILRLIGRVGAFEDPEIPAERAEDLPATRALIRRAGAEAVVLLKNEGALPLKPKGGATIAVIGPNAKSARAMGGGSAQLNPHYLVSPFDGLRAALPEDVMLCHEIGADNRRLAAVMKGEIHADFYSGADFTGPMTRTMRRDDGLIMFVSQEDPDIDVLNFSARVRARHTPETSGDHQFSLVSTGPSRLYVDGELVVDNSDFSFGEEFFATASDEATGMRRLEAGKNYEITVEWRSPDDAKPVGLTVLRMGLSPIVGPEAIERAAALARSADAALLFVGLNGEWDSEGKDRPNLDLPGRQEELIRRVAAANANTIVVLQSGGPVLMPWLDSVAAVLQAWYPGQEVGNAIADVLLGKAEPGGRLPQTFPRRLEDDPTRVNYPGEFGHVRYGEGIYVGYRYAEKAKIEPLFPFGFGLSYTRFAAGPLRLGATRLAPGETLTASVDITNIGTRAGSTVAQFYVVQEKASVSRPEKELRGFEKVFLAPGETKTVEVAIDMRALAFFDAARHAWVAEAGAFSLLAGFSSVEIVSRASFELSQTWIEAAAHRSAADGGDELIRVTDGPLQPVKAGID
jgi:beta-glucosidase